jgi:hypothetical protein
MGDFFSHAHNRLLGSIVLAAASVAFLSYAVLNFQMTKTSYPMPTTISVNGIGEASAAPNIGQFSFTVMAEGKSAAEAQDASAKKTNDVLAYLKEQGVEGKDVKTENYNLNPKYRYEERACAFGMYCPPGNQVADGFEVSQSVMVKVRDTAKSGELIAGVGDKGATNISSFSFVVDDTSAVKSEARNKAIADAKRQANELAEQLGVRIVRMVGYYENEAGYPMPYMEKAMSVADGMGGGTAPSMPVGENVTRSQVSVTYEVE